MRMVYLIGEPGSGKTTASRKLIETFGSVIQLPGPAKAMLFHETETLVLGHYDERTFSGTDTLSYTAADSVIEFLRKQAEELGVKRIFGEGDRLANSGFLNECASFCDLTVACLTVTPETATKRRTARGSKQDASWLKGRVSKVRRLAAEFGAEEIGADVASPSEIARRLSELLRKRI